MLDSHLAHLEIIGDLIPICKFSHTFAVLRRFDILIRDKMIRHQRDLILVKNAVHLHFFHFPDRDRAGNVIAEHQIQIRLDELSRFHGLKPRVSGQDLLCHSHSHLI